MLLTDPKPATIWRRFMGMIYEGLLLFGPLLVIGFVYSVAFDFSDKAVPELTEAKRHGLQVVVALALATYFTWGWSKGRCTLPMQTLGLKLQTKNHETLSTQRALLRAIVAVPSVFTGAGFLWALFDRDHQMLHDRIAGTRLLYVPVGRVI